MRLLLLVACSCTLQTKYRQKHTLFNTRGCVTEDEIAHHAERSAEKLYVEISDEVDLYSMLGVSADVIEGTQSSNDQMPPNFLSHKLIVQPEE